MAAWDDATMEVENLIEVPGATLFCKVKGTGPVVLIVQGGAADADGSDALAAHLESDFTVVSYDRRGLSRSVLQLGAPPLDISRHSEDASMVLTQVTSEPAFVFGVSIGALIALDLATTHPNQIRLLVAHEPPLKQLLPPDEFTKALYEQEEVEIAYREEGVRAAMMKFLELSGVDFGDREIDAPTPELSPNMTGNLEFFLAHDAPAVRRYQIGVSLLEGVKSKIIPATGETSSANWPNRCAVRLAEILSADLVRFPGGHNAYGSRPRGVAEVLRKLFRTE
jgi:pimeloyl-ACP methyl ester carboxylesterase